MKNTREPDSAPDHTVDAKYRALFYASALGIAVADPHTRTVIEVNPRFCELVGRNKQEILGQSFLSLTHPDDRDRDRAGLEGLLRGEIPEYRTEKRYIRPDGTIVWAEIAANLVREPDGVRAVTVALDITARKRAEEALAESERRMGDLHDAEQAREDAVMAQLHAVAMRTTEQDLKSFFEQIVEAAMGITGASMGKLQLLDLKTGALVIAAHRGFSAEYLSHFASVAPGRDCVSGLALASAKRLVFEDIERDAARFAKDDLAAMRAASVRAAQATPLLSRSGEVVGMLSTHYTEPRRPAEQHLPALDMLARLSADLLVQMRLSEGIKAAELRAQTFLGAVADPVIMVNTRGEIVYTNPVAERVFGYPPGGLLGQPHVLLIPERFRTAHAQHVRRFLEQPVARPMGRSGGLVGRRSDGSEFPIEVSLNPVETEDGVIVSTVVRDISERLKLEALAQIESERLASAIESIPDLVCVWDAEDKLVACNEAFRALVSGTVPEPLLGWTAAEISAWSERRFLSVQDALRLFLGEADSSDVQLADGRLWRARSSTMRGGGRVTAASDLTEDIRRQREIEAARESAEAASRAKSEFLASMSHELRTPMNAVLGFCQLLLRDRKEPLTERQREMVDQVYRGGEHLLHLIDDVLDLARIEANRVAILLQAVDAIPVIRQVLEALQPAAEQASVRLSFEPPALEIPAVDADPRRLTQILMNFGSNAIKYNRPKGTARFEIAPGSAPGRVRISVIDTGRGIAPKYHDKLFEPFQRAGQEAGPIEGTGIGLAISKRIALLMGGAVGFQSAPGEGSTFFIELSARSAEPKRSEPISNAPRVISFDRSLVLYVEDNKASLTLMRSALASMEGIELLEAKTAQEGISIARERKPDLILMDINLPDMSGIEAIKILRASRRTREIPVLALTAAASEQDRERGLQAGFARYLTKPLRFEDLDAALHELLSQRR